MTEETRKPVRLLPATSQVSVFYHAAEPGVAFDSLLHPEYWAHVAKQLTPGARIETAAADGAWWGMLLVRAAGQHDAVVQALQHVELGEADKATPTFAEYEIAWVSPTRKWGVKRLSDKMWVKQDFQTQGQAQQWVANRAKAA